jgi:catechol 2,3-dioxygenase
MGYAHRQGIAKLGHTHLVTPDLDKSLWFWSEIVGLEEVARSETEVYLRAYGEWEHHSLVLSKGPEARVDHIAWRTERPEDVDAYRRILEEQGIRCDVVEPGDELGQGRAIRFQVPHAGHTYEIYFDIEKPQAPPETRSTMKNMPHKAWRKGISPVRIDHVNVQTTYPTVEQGIRFHLDVLGFRLREHIRFQGPGMIYAWMSVTPLVHDVALGGAFEPPADPAPARLHHVAYWLDNWQDVLRANDILAEHNIKPDLGPGRHGISRAFFTYVRDPGSGHRLEVFSGSYLIFDPDWQSIEWTEEDYVAGLIWWGEQRPVGQMGAMALTTPA